MPTRSEIQRVPHGPPPFSGMRPWISPRKGPGVRHSGIRWVNCVKILTQSYASVSPSDTDGVKRRATEGVLYHLAQVGSYARLGSRDSGSIRVRLVEAEPSVRRERHRGAQQDRDISLDGSIELGGGYAHPVITFFYVR